MNLVPFRKTNFVFYLLRSFCFAEIFRFGVAKASKQNFRIMEGFSEGIYTFYTYILTNKNRTVLYTGVTNNLKVRLKQHKEKLNPNIFTARYNVEFLVYYEKYGWIQQAIEREKEIKLMNRNIKLDLIRNSNPNMEFLNHLFE